MSAGRRDTSPPPANASSCLHTWIAVRTLLDGTVKDDDDGRGHDALYTDEAFVLSAECGHLAHVRELISKRGDHMNMRAWDDAALFRASQNGHAEVVRLLLQHSLGKDVRALEPWRGLCKNIDIAVTVAYKHPEVVRELLLHGARGDACESVALSRAAAWGILETVRMLLAAGADPNQGWGKDALWSAAKNGHTQVVQELLQTGRVLDVNGKSDYDSPLFLAAKHGHLDIVRLLIAHGADARRLQDDLFLLCCITRPRADIIAELLNAGVSPNGRRGSALIMAAENGHVDVVRVLLEHGADANVCWCFKSVIGIAHKRGHTEVVRLLLRHGADACNLPYDAPVALYGLDERAWRRHKARREDPCYACCCVS